MNCNFFKLYLLLLWLLSVIMLWGLPWATPGTAFPAKYIAPCASNRISYVTSSPTPTPTVPPWHFWLTGFSSCHGSMADFAALCNKAKLILTILIFVLFSSLIKVCKRFTHRMKCKGYCCRVGEYKYIHSQLRHIKGNNVDRNLIAV